MDDGKTALERLVEALGNVGDVPSPVGNGVGGFAWRGSLPAESLSLGVDPIGEIRLPIAKSRAKKLASWSVPAPFGKGSETLYDASVRDVGEVHSRRLELDHAAWHRTLAPALEMIREALELPAGTLTASIDKLLVYGPGQFFKPHRDTERSDDMIGTLVVVLPSAHKGGTLRVSHRGQSASIRCDTMDADSLALLAFYADCEHEVEPVTEGYRVVLSHHLHFRPATREASGGSGASGRAAGEGDALVDQALVDFFAGNDDRPSWRRSNDKVVYLLDHAYSQRSLDWGRLKGKDSQRAKALVAAAERLGCEVYLAIVSLTSIYSAWKTDSGRDPWDDDWSDDWYIDSGNYHLDELLDRHAHLEHWRDVAGRKVGLPKLVAFEDELCSSVDEEAHTPILEEFEGYMGNYGNTLEREYRRAAVVLWPASERYRILAGSPGGGGLVLAEMRRDSASSSATELEDSLASFLAVWPGRQREKDSGALLDALKLAAQLDGDAIALDLLQAFSIGSLDRKVIPVLIACIEARGGTFALKLFERWLADGAATERGPRRRSGENGPTGQSYRDHDDPERLAWLKCLPALVSALDQAEGIDGGKLSASVISMLRELIAAEHAACHRLDSPGERAKSARREQRDLLHLLDALELHGDDGEILAVLAVLDADIDGYASGVIASVLERATDMSYGVVVADALENLFGRTTELVEARIREASRDEGDWRIPVDLDCSDADCETLKAFLESNAPAIDLPMAKARRRRLHHQLDMLELPVSHKTRREGSPHVLELRKKDALFRQAEKAVAEQRAIAARLAALPAFKNC